LAASFLEEDAEVIIIDALLRTGCEQNRDWLMGLAKVVEAFKAQAPFDFICHVGGQVAMTTSLADPRRDLRTNVVGTFNVLEAMRKHSPSALLAYSSTNKVYGDLEELHYTETESRYTLPQFPNGFDESLPLDFASPYGCSKGAADQYVRDWHRNYGLKTVVFRHSSIYGGRQFATFEQGWIGWFCTKAWEQKQNPNAPAFTIAGTGKQVRDVLHADDLVRLYRAAYLHVDTAAGQIFNIGGGIANSLSLLELFDRLARELELTQPLKFTRSPRRQSDQDFFVADVRKASALLGWEPKISAVIGLRRMLKWISGGASADEQT
jgi:CDP-paratose 2-epimerase